ncbi:MAG: recombination protein O N-terminal domain-containing protein [Paludibacteraceae bacterium]|nr:recombination protein O N-terminal domain-containing protein [Paludibacteraceae bacterium]
MQQNYAIMPTAIVLSLTKYSDTGSIVHLYTAEQGRMQYAVYETNTRAYCAHYPSWSSPLPNAKTHRSRWAVCHQHRYYARLNYWLQMSVANAWRCSSPRY